MRSVSLPLAMLIIGHRAAAADGPGSAAFAPQEITVTAPRGRAGAGVDPLLEISSSELDSYGADTLSDLVDALRPLTRSSRSDQTAVVLINGHLAGQTEFDNLPREAIERVEVLPETVALQYGFSENQRVLNFVLREHYRAAPLRISDSGATEGGGQIAAADASLVRLENEARITLLGSYKDSAWLRESDRGIDLPDSAYRTLQPQRADGKLAVTLSRALSGVSASFEASYEVVTADSLQGIADPGTSSTPDTRRALQQTAPSRTARVATQFTGQVRDLIWGVTAYYIHLGSRTSSDTGVDSGGTTLIDRADSALNTGNLQFSLSGRVASLPAGPVIANFKFGFQYQGFDTRNTLPGAAATASNLVRTVRSANVNANIPIANRDRNVLVSLGELAGTFNAAADDVADFGTLLSTSIGLDWNPAKRVHLNAIYTDHRAAPTVQQLRAPSVFTPNVETFDFITGQTAYVTQINGGDGSLARTDSRQASVGLSVGPFAGKTTFDAHYEQTEVGNAIGTLPPTTAAVETAFPERYLRGPDGSLIEVDNRWVNLARQRSRDLKWGFNLWIPLGASPPRAMPNRFEVSLFDTWYLHDVTVIHDGVPVLDLLNGAPSDLTGGQPRHKIEFHTLVHQNGIGVLLAAAWRSPTHVDSGDPVAPNPIAFSSLATAELRIFADFERLPLSRIHEWAKGARLSLAVTNVFDERQSVHDATGATPVAFQPGYLDPPGRVIGLSVRKVF